MAEPWEDLLKIADKHQPAFKRLFLDAVEAVQLGMSAKDLEDALSKSDIMAIDAAFGWDNFDDALQGLKPLVIEVLKEAGEMTGFAIGDKFKVKFRFDLVDPNAITWINQHAAEDITGISEKSRAAIREIIRRGYFEGYTPRQQAQFIRGLIGLDERRAIALAKYREGLLEGGTAPGQVDKFCDRYYKRLLNSRAITIAIDQTSEASNRGSFESTRQAVARGVIDPAKYEGSRLVTPDDRLCPTCRGVNGERRSLPDGVYPSTQSNIAKVHTICRCCEVLKPIR